MKNLLSFIFICFCIAPKVYGQVWIPFNSPEGKFSVLFPFQPKMQTDSSATFKKTAFVSESFGDMFAVGWLDFEKSYKIDEQKELEACRDNLIKSVNGTLVKSMSTTVWSYNGIDFTAKFGNHILTSRLFIAQRRFYQLFTRTIIGEEGDDNGAEDEQKFYNSFKLKKD